MEPLWPRPGPGRATRANLEPNLLHAARHLGNLSAVTDLVVDEELTSNADGDTQLRRYWRPAEGAGKPRTAMVLVHGIGEHSGRYDHVGRYLAEQGHDVVGFDNRGHGQSSGRRGHIDHFGQFLDDVEAVLDDRRSLGVPVVLLGHSLGGLISATYGVSGRPQPDLLVLSAPALAVQAPRWQRLAAPVLSKVAPKLFVKADLDAGLLSSDEEVQRAYRDDPLRVKGATAKLGQEIFTTMVATTAQLDRLTIPTYVLHGADDELVPPAASAPLEGRANVTYRRWPGLRHECLNEPARHEVLAEIEQWLSTQLDDLPS